MPPKSDEIYQRVASTFPTWIVLGLLAVIIGFWSNLVNKTVPDPYLVRSSNISTGQMSILMDELG